VFELCALFSTLLRVMYVMVLHMVGHIAQCSFFCDVLIAAPRVALMH